MTPLLSLALSLCPDTGKRYHCLVDGDTAWIEGVKVRFEGIDTPETGSRAKCPYERSLAAEATLRALELMNAPNVEIVWTGRKDRYGRDLVKVPAVSEQLIREGLARRWTGRRESWCN